jgi:hypothetical protein
VYLVVSKEFSSRKSVSQTAPELRKTNPVD